MTFLVVMSNCLVLKRIFFKVPIEGGREEIKQGKGELKREKNTQKVKCCGHKCPFVI